MADDDFVAPYKRRRLGHDTPIRQREDCAISQREARHAMILKREGVILFLISTLIFMATDPAFSDVISMGCADDILELWQHVGVVFMAAGAARISAWSKITWLDPKLWLFYYRDPEYTCNFEHYLSGRGRGTAWGLMRVRATDLARLASAWAIPAYFRAANRSLWDGEEALVAFLVRCATNIVWQQLEPLLNRRFQDLSKMFYLVLHHIRPLPTPEKT